MAAAYHAHSFAEHVHDSLISERARVGQEEVAQHDVEERQRRDDGLCGYERHGERAGGRQMANGALESGGCWMGGIQQSLGNPAR